MTEISVALNEYRLAGVLAFLHQAADAPRLLVFSGTRPTFGEPALHICSIPLKSPAGVVTNGVLILTPSDDAIAAGTGTPTWGRLVDGDGELGLQFDVGPDGSGAEVIVSESQIYAGGFCRLVSGALV